MSQQQEPTTVSVDEVPVEPSKTLSGEVELSNIPEEIRSITEALASQQPPTNPLVVLKAARWWYAHGKGVSDPAFRWALDWALQLATDRPSDVERFEEFLEYLVNIGFADERADLRWPSRRVVVAPQGCGAARPP